jgi:hypothetical protein
MINILSISSILSEPFISAESLVRLEAMRLYEPTGYEMYIP